MGPDHTCMLTNPMQDHWKLSSQLICDEISSVIGDNPSLKGSTIISHIRAEYEYTPSYRKAWIARTKSIEKVFGNWEESYKQLPKYLLALKQYAPGTIVKLETNCPPIHQMVRVLLEIKYFTVYSGCINQVS